MAKKATVSGGTGFIGRRLVPLLVERGYDVTVIARQTSNIAGLPADIRILRTGLSDTDTLKKEIAETEFFFHLAGLTKAKNRDRMLEINRDRVIELARMCRDFPSFKRFIFLSSQAASRPGRSPVSECDTCSPKSCYGQSKLEAERALQQVDIPSTILRPPTVYGPYDRDVFFYFRLAHMGFVPVVGNPDRLFSYIYVDDLVRGIVDMAENPCAEGRTLFISSEKPVSWGDFASTMQRVSAMIKGKKPMKLPIPFFIMYIAAFFNTASSKITGSPPLLSFDKVREMKESWVCDSSEIRRLGFSGEIPLEEGLFSTYNWYIKKGWLGFHTCPKTT